MTDKWTEWCKSIGPHIIKETTIEFQSNDRKYLNSVTYSMRPGLDNKLTPVCTRDVHTK